MVATFVAALAMSTITMIVVFVATVIVVVMAAMLVTILRHIHIVVPVFLHKVDWSAAGAIFTAMLAPVLGMAAWHMQIQRLYRYSRLLNDDGLGINQCWAWVLIANIDLAIKARLTNVDRNTHIGGEYGRCC